MRYTRKGLGDLDAVSQDQVDANQAQLEAAAAATVANDAANSAIAAGDMNSATIIAIAAQASTLLTSIQNANESGDYSVGAAALSSGSIAAITAAVANYQNAGTIIAAATQASTQNANAFRASQTGVQSLKSSGVSTPIILIVVAAVALLLLTRDKKGKRRK